MVIEVNRRPRLLTPKKAQSVRNTAGTQWRYGFLGSAHNLTIVRQLRS